jgi:hypothetical protein
MLFFLATIGIMVLFKANIFYGLHWNNIATGFGNIEICLKMPDLTQTWIVNSYLDYTGSGITSIVVKDALYLKPHFSW